jgi:uncharacterized protein
MLDPRAPGGAAARLRAALAAHESLLVGLSGGVDSAVLVAAAQRFCGGRVLAVTGRSPSVPASDLADAARVAAALGVEHLVVDTHELAVPAYAANGPDRCFHCKSHLFARLQAVARECGLAAVAEGSNADDAHDYRPGLDAVRRLGVVSPLLAAGLTKAEVRALAREWGLDVADKPAMACLSSRFPYGEALTAAGLERVDRAEAWLRAALGLRQVRVRSHGDLARVEVGDDEGFAALAARRHEVRAALVGLGFLWVALDLGGYRTGSLNAALGRGAAGDDAPPESGSGGRGTP